MTNTALKILSLLDERGPMTAVDIADLWHPDETDERMLMFAVLLIDKIIERDLWPEKYVNTGDKFHKHWSITDLGRERLRKEREANAK